MIRRTGIPVVSAAILVVAMAVLVACGGGGTTQRSVAPATVNVTISDPPTCSDTNAPAGPFHSIFVTITKVQIHASATAGDSDPGWIDLVTGINTQIDLLSVAASKCFLATLGTATNLAPGSYQQVRIFLSNSNASTPGCGSAGANCVVLSSDLSNPRPLLLSSGGQTGIKIPSGQIAGGRFTVGPSDNKTLNIDFNACASIVTMGNGQFRLKPVLHAGEVNTTSNSIEGKVVDGNTLATIPGVKAIVALEQKDAGGIDRVIMQTSPDPATGNFSFCPVNPGTYDVVIVAESGTGASYAAAIITGVGPGAALGAIKMTPVTGGSTAAGSITGRVTTVDASSLAKEEDVTLSVLQGVTINSNSFTFTIPLVEQIPASATANVHTLPGGTCAANTACADFTLAVPGVTPTAVAFTTVPITFSGGAVVPASYTVEAAGNCSPATTTSAAVNVSPGAPTALAAPLALTSCQ